jgi:NADPH:quinone reductase-like Zn-dependent oxidoreductase
MPRAVRFDKYGGLEVLQVVEVDRPTPGPGKVACPGQSRGH